MIIGGRRARHDNERDAAQCQAAPGDGVIRDAICSEGNKRREMTEEEEDTRLYVQHNLELDGLTMKLSTTKRTQEPIVREDIFREDAAAEKGMKYRKHCDTRKY